MVRSHLEPAYQARQELLIVADSVAREKNIDREDVLVAMEDALQRSIKLRYGFDRDIRVNIDRKTGELKIQRCLTVVAEVHNNSVEISLEDAHLQNKNLELGDVISEELPAVEMGRVAARNARQIIMQRVKDAERQHQYEEFKERQSQIVSGVVKRIEFGNIIVDLGRAEAFLPKDQVIPREVFHVGDRIRALVMELKPDARGHMIQLSRVHPHFMAKLFEQEVPEIYEGVIEIMAVSRDPGSRAKMAVSCNDAALDPVGACVGLRGSRVQAVTMELRGEKVDIILWSPNEATFVVNALTPAEVTKVVLDDEKHRFEVVVPEDQLSLAIGRRGQNVRLASDLTGWRIDIMTESEESTKRTEEHSKLIQIFIESLNIDEMMAQLLVAEGLTAVEEIHEVHIDELTTIDGLDETTALELKKRAEIFLEKQKKEKLSCYKELGAKKDLIDFIQEWPVEWGKLLIQNSIKSLEDFAGLATDDLFDIFKHNEISQEEAEAVIMEARSIWYK
jgi:N utilization substance protein A